MILHSMLMRLHPPQCNQHTQLLPKYYGKVHLFATASSDVVGDGDGDVVIVCVLCCVCRLRYFAHALVSTRLRVDDDDGDDFGFA